MGFIIFKNPRILQKRTLSLTQLSHSDLIAENTAVTSYCGKVLGWKFTCDKVTGGTVLDPYSLPDVFTILMYRSTEKLEVIGPNAISV